MPITGTPIAPSGAYSSTDGTNAFLRRNAWLKSDVVSEPLTGVVNGSNRRFRLQSYPAVTDTVSVIDMNGDEVAVISVDESSGVVITSDMPTDTIFADYTHCAYTQAQLNDMFIEGFATMESIWQRGYYLVYSGGVYYVSSSSGSIVDPVVADSTFSARPVQYALLSECMQLAWAQATWNESAANAIQVRESLAAGVNVDRTRQPSALRDLVEEIGRRVKIALENAKLDAGEAWFEDEDGLAIAGTADQYPNVWTTPIYAASS